MAKSKKRLSKAKKRKNTPKKNAKELTLQKIEHIKDFRLDDDNNNKMDKSAEDLAIYQELYNDFMEAYTPTETDLKRELTQEQLKELCLRKKCRILMRRWNLVTDYEESLGRRGRLDTKCRRDRNKLVLKAVKHHMEHGKPYTDEEIKKRRDEEWAFRKKDNILSLELWQYDRENHEKSSNATHLEQEPTQQIEEQDELNQFEEKENKSLNILQGNTKNNLKQKIVNKVYKGKQHKVEMNEEQEDISKDSNTLNTLQQQEKQQTSYRLLEQQVQTEKSVHTNPNNIQNPPMVAFSSNVYYDYLTNSDSIEIVTQEAAPILIANNETEILINPVLMLNKHEENRRKQKQQQQPQPQELSVPSSQSTPLSFVGSIADFWNVNTESMSLGEMTSNCINFEKSVDKQLNLQPLADCYEDFNSQIPLTSTQSQLQKSSESSEIIVD